MTVAKAEEQSAAMTAGKIPAGTKGNKTPFDILHRFQTFSNDAQKAWWKETGPLLSRVLCSANYSEARQLEALMFYSQVLLPLLGPYPQTFRSAITRSGLPLEFSVNYQQHGGVEPVVRIGFEPVARESGTAVDRFNQQPIKVLLDRLADVAIPGYADTLFQHFFEAHTLNADERGAMGEGKMDGSDLTSQAAFGFDMRPDTISVKGYTFPALKSHVLKKDFGALIVDSVEPLRAQMGDMSAFDMVNAYMNETNGFSQFAFWSFDCGHSTRSRLKLYSSHTSVVWSKIEDIWTLGGRAQSPTTQKGLECLRDLWACVGIAEEHRTFTGGFDDGVDSTPTPMVWNYEVKADEPIPMTKFYFPVHGECDQRVVRGVSKFLVNNGMAQYGEKLEETVGGLFPQHDMSTTARLVSWVSFAYTEKTGVYLSIYYHSSDSYPWEGKE